MSAAFFLLFVRLLAFLSVFALLPGRVVPVHARFFLIIPLLFFLLPMLPASAQPKDFAHWLLKGQTEGEVGTLHLPAYSAVLSEVLWAVMFACAVNTAIYFAAAFASWLTNLFFGSPGKPGLLQANNAASTLVYLLSLVIVMNSFGLTAVWARLAGSFAQYPLHGRVISVPALVRFIGSIGDAALTAAALTAVPLFAISLIADLFSTAYRKYFAAAFAPGLMHGIKITLLLIALPLTLFPFMHNTQKLLAHGISAQTLPAAQEAARGGGAER